MIHRLYRSVRLIVVALLLLAVLLVAALYVGLSLPAVQDAACRRVEGELSRMLGADVTIRSLGITPFNRVMLRDVVIADAGGSDTLAKARRLGAGLSLTDLIMHRRMVVNYIEAVGLDLRLWRDSAGAPLNIAPVLARLSRPGGDGGVPDLRINAIVVRRSRLSFDDRSVPLSEPGHLNPAHIQLDDLRADLRLGLDKSSRSIGIELSRLAATEVNSGLVLTDLAAKALLLKAPAPDGAIARVNVKDLVLTMPGSRLAFAPTTLSLRPTLDVTSGILPGSHLSPADLRPLLPALPADLISSRIDISLSGRYTGSDASLDHLDLALANGSVTVSLPQGATTTGLDSIMSATFALPALEVTLGSRSAPFLASLPLLTGQTADTLWKVPAAMLPVTLAVEAQGRVTQGTVHAAMMSEQAGSLDAWLDYELTDKLAFLSAEGRVELNGLKAAMIAGGIGIDNSRRLIPQGITATLEGRAVKGAAGIPDGIASLAISSLTMTGRDGAPVELTDIMADVKAADGIMEGMVESANTGLALTAEAAVNTQTRNIDFDLVLDDLDLFIPSGGHLSLTALGEVSLLPQGSMLPATGTVALRDIIYGVPGTEKRLSLEAVDLAATLGRDGISPEMTLTSDLIKARLRGSFDPSGLGGDLRGLAASLFPELAELPRRNRHSGNNFDFEARILTTEPLEHLVKLPVQVRYPVNIEATLSSAARRARFRLDAPYLWQGNKEIDSTSVEILATGSSASIAAATRMPSKHGMMGLSLRSGLPAIDSLGTQPRTVMTRIGWKVDAERNFAGRDFSGTVAFDVTPGREMTNVDFRRSELTFNDTVWTMEPSVITIRKQAVEVDGFRVGRPGQHIEIDGRVTASDDDSLTISLDDINLDYVFETLNIPNVMFGGTATGELYASGLLGKNLRAYTPDLFVRGLKYNNSLMGDTRIKASFDPMLPAVNLDAKVDQPNGLSSFIKGYIKPTSEGYIDLDFRADRIEVGFMLPFMSAFATDVSGYASGNAHLFGTFHDVNMSGDIYAEDLALTLGFTGCTYYTTDSVHLTPGYIDLDGITLRDRSGNTARLGGYLRHTNFHLPRFEFRITDARDLLVYDLPESPDRRWYGTIYGNGSATVTGIPGHIDIGVEMTTAPRSSFGFILSDAQEAYDYRFITFRDRDAAAAGAVADAITDGIPSEVSEIRRALAKKADEQSSSIYDMTIKVSVTPDAQLTVVMDPVGGDAIRARGSGDMTMTYNSASEVLGLRGDYTLDNGTYNFTFQDIIRKDFRINSGSTIRFNGDPYAAQLDIEAAYRLTANLSDLDESFLDDPELTRTSVPVDALLRVTGDMRQPDLAYDFAFPTLKDDIKRKVNSIVSTDEMRARQMLYLLALNRFYTPEYMSATKGNELFSVASSTLSSQISNLLGSLAQNWTIAPNIRSDRGDFSDVEFDLALSSSLLNNRLLFNGNFVYRDKSLNNNTFIGDFDLEYLLNRSGSLRLKAYNRYNDQNYYFKSALTTQGVGIVFRRDFDSMDTWLKALFRRKPKSRTENPADTTATP